MGLIRRQEVSLAIAQLIPNIIRGTHLDFFLKHGLTQTQFLMLKAIHAYGRCTMGHLARSMHVKMPTATGIVGRLVRAGYVRRLPDPKDRRQVVVELTARGQAFIRQFQQVVRHRWEDVLKALGTKELGAFYRVIMKLQEQLQIPR